LAATHASIVLFSGIVDIIAGLVVKLAERRPARPTDISWRNMLAGKKSVYKDLTGSASKIREVALAMPVVEIGFLLDVRNHYAHNSSLPGGVGQFESGDRLTQYGQYCLIDLGQVADARNIDVPECFLGAFDDGRVQPLQLQKRIIQLAVSLIERVAEELDRSKAEWWIADGAIDDHSVRVQLGRQHAQRWWRY
jgi:hypothetical protein